jgi:hypothetical protein
MREQVVRNRSSARCGKENTTEKYGGDNLRLGAVPSNRHLLFEDEHSPLSKDVKRHRSPVAALMYLARMTRSDIMHTVAVLVTRSNTSTEEDYGIFLYLLAYLANTNNIHSIELFEAFSRHAFIANKRASS